MILIVVIVVLVLLLLILPLLPVVGILRLCSLGGHNETDVLNRIMGHLLSNTLASEFNWMGRGDKKGFRGLKLSKIVKVSARRSWTGMTEATCENKIKSWLKYSKDRAGGRKLREQKKKAAAAANTDEAEDTIDDDDELFI
ncbi:uncharacterized protein [Antedon mediterranea]|uniref:uncharacterized protein isoform X2 n=1 Tax=Antedon mediterranea TaxID=105859 RepID=UPI003AF6691B